MKIKAWAVFGPALVALAVLLSLPPIAQSENYHEFVDQSSLLGIPHFWDVTSNVTFVIVGVLGLSFLRRARFIDSRERPAYRVFFAAVLLTGLGSAWYHLNPTSERLFWDRLPMTLVFMSLFSIVLSERLGPALGSRLLVPLLVAGLASVLYWYSMGDLRFYVLVQFYPILVLPVILLLYKPRYTHSSHYWALTGWYALAKMCEFFDAEILQMNGLISGHTLKHILAAVATYWVLRMIERRSPQTAETNLCVAPRVTTQYVHVRRAA